MQMQPKQSSLQDYEVQQATQNATTEDILESDTQKKGLITTQRTEVTANIFPSKSRQEENPSNLNIVSVF